jgi:uncharacterized membrane protein YphA (DoxX/SURF4 family)
MPEVNLKSQRIEEAYKVLKLPSFSDIFIIIFELTVGILLLTNFKYKLYALLLLLIFLIVGFILIIVNNMDELLKTYHEIWIYQPTSMSFVLHLASTESILPENGNILSISKNNNLYFDIYYIN